jgi:two-component system LytT family response regulator
MVELAEVDRLRGRLLAALGGGDRQASERQAEARQAEAPRGPATPPPGPPPGGYLERIAVEMRGKAQIVPVSQIDYIVASGPYAELYVAGRRHLIREAMQTLEERLDPARFFRIHRSAIVRLDLIETLYRGAGGDYEVQLRGGTRLRVSRSRREELERRLGVGGVG